MKQAGKYTGAFFLWLAMLVLLVHSVVPHNHHATPSDCETRCLHGDIAGLSEEKPAGEHSSSLVECDASHDHESCQACHFSAVTTVELSKSLIHSPLFAFVLRQIYFFQAKKIQFYDNWVNHYSFDFLGIITSRGPPSLK